MISWLSSIAPQIHMIWRGKWKAGTIEPARFLYDHELVVVIAGSCTVQVGQRMHELRSGDYLIVPPNTFHVTTTGAHGVHRYCIHFDWEPTTRHPRPSYCFYPERPDKRNVIKTPASVPASIFHGTCPPDGIAVPIMETLFHRWQTGEQLAQATCRAVFLELLTRLLWRDDRRRQPANHSTQLAHAVKDLLDRCGDRPTAGIQNLLRSLGFSYPHLCRLFRSTFGVTPVEYRTAVRLERAKALLRDPRLTVSEVAYAAGFDDPGYFARRFRQQNGVTPSAFR